MQRISCMPLDNLNVHTACRTCLTKLEEYHPIIFEIPEFLKIFSDCTALPVKLGDGLPTGLCDSCFAKINDIYIFQEICRTAAKRFAEHDKLKKQTKPPPVLKEEFSVETLMKSLEAVQGQCFSEADDVFIDNPADILIGEEKIEHKFEGPKESIQMDTNLSEFDFDSIIICDYGENEDYGDANIVNTQTANKIPEIQTKQPTLRERFERLQASNKLRRARTKTKTKPKKISYCCETCGKVLQSKATFEVHTLSHTNQPRPFACDLCPKTFTMQHALKDHLDRHAGLGKFVCTVCGIRKFRPSELKLHMNKHTKEKVWKCEICGRECCSKLSYDRHKEVIHEGIKKFKCTYCDRLYALDYQRRNHERFHKNERPFVCHLCGSSFTLNGHLQVHVKRHNGPQKEPRKRVSCEFCGESLRSMNDLVNHAKAVHKGQKYQCSYCEKDFTTYAARKDHESIHTGENLRQCELCPRTYHSSCALSIHKRRAHKNQKPAEPAKAE